MKKLIVLAALAFAAVALARSEEKKLLSEGTVEASVEDVWQSFTTREGLESWMAPMAEIDLRVGGLMRSNYNPQGRIGDATTITNTILSYEPLRMFSIKATGPPENFPFKNALARMWTVIYFERLADKQTKVTVIGLGFGDDPESQKLYEFFKKGNAATLEQLRSKFSRRN